MTRWSRICTALTLIASVLAGGYLATAPAQAVPAIPCSGVSGVGAISSAAAFNAAVDKVNIGACNVIDVSSGFTFTTAPASIEVIGSDLWLSITGPTGGATLNGNAAQGIRIAVLGAGSDLNLTVERLTFTNFDGTGFAATGQSALLAGASGALNADLQNVTFTNNTGVLAGGLHLQGDTSAEVEMTGTITFSGNSSTYGAGGMAVSSYSTTNNTLTLGTSGGTDAITFSNNTNVAGPYPSSGGGISGRNITVNGGTFSTNSASQSGGAIYASGSVALNGTNFTGNTAAGNEGGAVHAEGQVTVDGGTFTSNGATGSGGAGGAIASNETVATMFIRAATFITNSAGGNGGAISSGGPVEVSDSTFDGNSADRGGAIDAYQIDVSSINSVNVTSTNNIFEDNVARDSAGGAILSFKSVVSEGSQYLSNSAIQAGAISASGNVESTDDTFTANEAETYDGGAIVAEDVVTSSSTFSRNIARRNGGAISARSVVDSGSQFSRNTSRDRGGSINVSYESQFTGSSFSEDSAVLGGSIYSYGPLSVTNSIFEGGLATDLGGAIYVYDTLNIANTTFNDNVALQTGGAVATFGAATVTGSLFQRNVARGPEYNSNGAGGAIFANSTVEVATSSFLFNTAIHEGGAISANGSVELTDSTFSGNSSLNWEGGAVYVSNPGTATIARSTFTANTSASSGGALRVDGPIDVTASTFANNATTTGSTNGGAIAAAGAISITGSEFTANSATQWGGALWSDSSVDVDESLFEGNSSTGNGGAVYVGTQLTISKSTFRDNSSGSLGGVFNARNAVISDSSFVGNESSTGGVGFVSRDVQTSNSTFYDNYGVAGGVFGIDGGSTTLSRIAYSTLVDNTSYPGNGSAFVAGLTVPIALTGSVVAGAGPLCWSDATPIVLDFRADSTDSFATDTSCSGGGASSDSSTINTLYTSPTELGINGAITTNAVPGRQVIVPSATSVLKSAAPTGLVSGVTTDQLGALRDSPTGRTTVGAVQIVPVSFASQPQNLTVQSGTGATFTVFAGGGIGGPPTYQWQSSTDESTWIDITGNASARTSALTLSAVTEAESGLKLRVLVSTSRSTVTSDVATLTITPAPAPTPSVKKAQEPTKPVALPKVVEPNETTTLVKRTITTNAGQDVKVRVTCVSSNRKALLESKAPACKVKRSATGKVSVKVKGKSTRVTVKMTAPATTEYKAYRYTKNYKVR